MEQRLLKLLEKFRTFGQLKQTHAQILVNGLLLHSTFILPKLVSLSAELCSLGYAIKTFRSSINHNVVAYNTMIKCFDGKSYEGAMRVYDQMKVSGVMPNSFTFTSLLRCFEAFDVLRDGLSIHSEIVKLGFRSDVFVQNTLLDFYAKCGENLDAARRVFDEMPDKDTVSWNSMISACMNRDEVESAFELFEKMPERNVVTWNSVVSGLSKAGNMSLALSVFERMPVSNAVSYNSMISGYVRLGDVKAAQAIFDRMPEKTVVSWTALITGYTVTGDLESALRIFDQMPIKNVISWNAMISGYVHNHMFDQALALFQRMLVIGECKPDQTTLLTVLSACSHLGSLEHGQWIDSYIKKNKIDLSTSVGNALIDMFAKCGDMVNSIRVFDTMRNKCIITWTTIITGLAFNGKCKDAVHFFDGMCLEGVKPDDVVFVAVLSACNHGGLVEDGRRIFNQMIDHYKIEPRIEHYGCMVDLLGRAGKLEEALKFIENMHLEPNAVIWAALLSSCKIHGNGELLELVTKKILEQEPLNPSYLMLISNLSASIGKWDYSSSYRVSMRKHGMEKIPGCSSIQVGNCIHEFLSKDITHKRRNDIYDTLEYLNGHLKET